MMTTKKSKSKTVPKSMPSAKSAPKKGGNHHPKPKNKNKQLSTQFRKLSVGYGSIGKIMGHGSYAVNSNTMSKTCGALELGAEIPKFSSSSTGFRVTHREFVADLTAPTLGSPYTLFAQYDINPANAKLFPWLETFANSFQQYKFNGLVVEFKSMSSEYASGAALGTVIISTNYNANLPVFNSKLQAENSDFAVSSKPSLSQIHAIECDPKQRPTEFSYIQPDNFTGSGDSDKRFTSYGTLQIATQGLSAALGTVIGEIWVSYDIEFLKPIIQSDSIIELQEAGDAYTTGGTVSTSYPFGTLPDNIRGEKTCSGMVAMVPATGSTQAPANRLTYKVPGTYFVTHRHKSNSTSATIGPYMNEIIPAVSGVASTLLNSYTGFDGTNNNTLYFRKHVVTAAGQYADYTSTNDSTGKTILNSVMDVLPILAELAVFL